MRDRFNSRVRASPSFSKIGSSDTWNTTVSSGASMVCACQHGIATTSPTPSVSSKPSGDEARLAATTTA